MFVHLSDETLRRLHDMPGFWTPDEGVFLEAVLPWYDHRRHEVLALESDGRSGLLLNIRSRPWNPNDGVVALVVDGPKRGELLATPKPNGLTVAVAPKLEWAGCEPDGFHPNATITIDQVRYDHHRFVCSYPIGFEQQLLYSELWVLASTPEGLKEAEQVGLFIYWLIVTFRGGVGRQWIEVS